MFQVSMFQGDESLPFIRVDELELQPPSSAQNSLRIYKFNGRLVVVKKLAVDVSEEALEDHAIKWNALKQHPNVSRICGISDRGFDPPFIVVRFSLFCSYTDIWMLSSRCLFTGTAISLNFSDRGLI